VRVWVSGWVLHFYPVSVKRKTKNKKQKKFTPSHMTCPYCTYFVPDPRPHTAGLC